MIASTIGRTFLKAYNEREGTSYTAKEFFEKIYFDLFFNHSKYFFWPQNSPFVQGITTLNNGELGLMTVLKDEKGSTRQFETDEELDAFCSQLQKEPTFGGFKTKTKKQIKIIRKLDAQKRKEILTEFVNKVNEAKKNHNIEASVAIGFPASEMKEYATTSGAVTDMNFSIDIEDVYYSWIGGGLGIGIAGGYSIFLDTPQILLKLYDGWKTYRTYLNDNTLEHMERAVA